VEKKIEISPITGSLGAIIEGVDLSNFDVMDLEVVKDALNQHLVVKLPQQNLDRFKLSKLGSIFGPHFHHPIEKKGFRDCPEVLQLLHKPGDTKMFGGASWHADITWLKPCGYLSFLHAIEIPEVGGDTSFSSTISAFDTLSAGLKDLLRGLNGIHAYHWSEGKEQLPWIAEHPVVRTHPVSGLEGLFVNRMFTSRFSNMTASESKPLLEFLFNKMEIHEVTCRFRWNKGDLLIWDNRFTLHYPINDFFGNRREMIRTSVMETKGGTEAAEKLRDQKNGCM